MRRTLVPVRRCPCAVKCACGCGEPMRMVNAARSLWETGLSTYAVASRLQVSREYVGYLLKNPPVFIKGHLRLTGEWPSAACIECGRVYKRHPNQQRYCQQRWCQNVRLVLLWNGVEGVRALYARAPLERQRALDWAWIANHPEYSEREREERAERRRNRDLTHRSSFSGAAAVSLDEAFTPTGQRARGGTVTQHHFVKAVGSVEDEFEAAERLAVIEGLLGDREPEALDDATLQFIRARLVEEGITPHGVRRADDAALKVSRRKPLDERDRRAAQRSSGLKEQVEGRWTLKRSQGGTGRRKDRKFRDRHAAA